MRLHDVTHQAAQLLGRQEDWTLPRRPPALANGVLQKNIAMHVFRCFGSLIQDFMESSWFTA